MQMKRWLTFVLAPVLAPALILGAACTPADNTPDNNLHDWDFDGSLLTETAAQSTVRYRLELR